ncbi:hypothetical protein Dimus_034200 [Dionaea muscipula]
MAFWSSSSPLPLLGLLSYLLLLLHLIMISTTGIRVGVMIWRPALDLIPVFREAPAFVNGNACGSHNADKIHISMTLDANYLRGTMAAVLSMLQHSTCPENFVFHFLAARSEREIYSSINFTFPYLNFKIYRFDSNRVRGKISKSIRQALDQPLNYARIYLADILPSDVARVIYLDSDVIVVDDISKLWEVDLGTKVMAAPEYCHANFTNYFIDSFWSDPSFASTFEGRKPCYFNTGVMVLDVDKWRKYGYTQKVEEWMLVQKQRRIYHLGSLPPFLLVLAGNIKAVDHRWNQHGLGGDNFEGPVQLQHQHQHQQPQPLPPHSNPIANASSQQQQQLQQRMSRAPPPLAGNQAEIQMAYQDAWRVCHPDFKRPFSSLEDACERLLPYHVVADYEAEEDDRILDSDTTGQMHSRSQQWDLNIAAKVAEFTATFEKQALAFNIITRKRALGEFRSEERLMVEQALFQEEKRSLMELRAEIESREKAGREAHEAKLRMAGIQAEQACVESQAAHTELIARAPMRALVGSQGNAALVGHELTQQERQANSSKMMNGWGTNVQRDEKEPSEDFLNDEEAENGDTGTQEEWRDVGEFDLNSR